MPNQLFSQLFPFHSVNHSVLSPQAFFCLELILCTAFLLFSLLYFTYMFPILFSGPSLCFNFCEAFPCYPWKSSIYFFHRLSGTWSVCWFTVIFFQISMPCYFWTTLKECQKQLYVYKFGNLGKTDLFFERCK